MHIGMHLNGSCYAIRATSNSRNHVHSRSFNHVHHAFMVRYKRPYLVSVFGSREALQGRP